MSDISATWGLVHLFWIVITILAAYGFAMFMLGYMARKRDWLSW